jgi:pimeloyl-ACP methyl ester carboxylesterase
MGHQNLGEARNLEVGLAKGGSDIGKITEEGVFHHPVSAVVQEALTASGAKYVVLYGHSMGGLVIREYLNSQANVDKVARVLTAGTPYWGAPKAHFSLLGGYTDTPAGGGLDHITWQKELQTLSRNLQGAFFSILHAIWARGCQWLVRPLRY